MATSSQIFFTGSSTPGASYSTTTLTASLTTAFTSESVYTSYGQEETTTFLVATVIPPDTVVINETTTTKRSPKKTIIIVGAALGGFIVLVVIGLVVLALNRRRRRRRPQMISAPPSVGYASPNIPPASLTPFIYQPPENAQPHHEPLLVNNAPNMAVYHSPVISEKRRNVLQRPSHNHMRGPSDATSISDSGSVQSQPHTNSSGISSSPQPTGFAQAVHKSRPPHPHQRSLSGGGSDAGSVGQQSDRRNSVNSSGGAPSGARMPVSTPPSFNPMTGHPGMPTAPMIQEETPPNTAYGHQGFQPQGQNQSFQPQWQTQPFQPQGQNQAYQPQGQNQPFQHNQSFHAQQTPQNQGFYDGQQQGYTSASGNRAPSVAASYNSGHQHRTSYHAQNAYTGQGPTYPTQGASSSSAQPGGSDPGVIGATVDRGDGEAAHVYALKDARRNEARRRELEDGLNDSATNLSELPPAYASLRPRTDMG